MADFSSGKWIWAKDNKLKRDRVMIRRAFTLEKPPKSAVVYASARDSFGLFVNGKPVALGIFGCGGYDVGKYLVKGENVLGFDCMYYGEAANGYVPPAESGLIVASPDLGIFSDKEFTVLRPYCEDPGEPCPSGRFWGFDSYTDGSRGEIANVFDAGYGSTLLEPAEEYGAGTQMQETDWRNCEYEGTIRAKKMTKTTEGTVNTYVFEIGEEKTFYPVVELSAMGTERIEIKSNRYVAGGAYGDERKYNGVRAVYVCRNGLQRYDSPVSFRGSAVVIVAPATVVIKSVELRVVGYPASSPFGMSIDGRIATLIEKCDETMRACMCDGVVDNTDRDRGYDLLALSAFTRSAMYFYDDSVLPLVRQSILNAAECDGFTLKNYTGSPAEVERPVSSLMFASGLGAPAAYYYRTGDAEFISQIHRKLCGYLMLWNFSGTKLLSRAGNPKYIDAGYNVDAQLIETCLYYSAAKFLLDTADAAQDGEYTAELQKRADVIADNFDNNFFHVDCYTSGGCCDERANALAVVTGLAGSTSVDLAGVLCSCRNASPAYEGLVVEALGMIGKAEEAKKRLILSNFDFIYSPSPALPEYFHYNGSKCSARSVTPVSATVAGITGMRYTGVKKLTFTPPALDEDVKLEFPFADGTVKAAIKGDTVVVDNSSACELTVHYDGRAETIAKGKIKMTKSR